MSQNKYVSPFISDRDSMLESVRVNGFFVLKGFFDAFRVKEVRAELEGIIDSYAMKQSGLTLPSTVSKNGVVSELTDMMHTVLFPSVLCPSYAELWAEVMSDSKIKELISSVAGNAVQMRVDLVRRSTGIDDAVDEIQIPHNWHRDTLGEFTFGIFLDDLSMDQSGGTIAVPGTHWTAFDPIWDFIIGDSPSYTNKSSYLANKHVWMSSESAKRSIANKQLQSEFLSNRVEMKGTFGDIYFFLNDVFHGRAVNSTGRKLMMSRFGGFSSAFEFKNDIRVPSFPPEFPNVISELYRPKTKFEITDSFLLGEISRGRKGGHLQHLARLEKMILINEELITNLTKQVADSGMTSIKSTNESYLHLLKNRIRRVANRIF